MVGFAAGVLAGPAQSRRSLTWPGRLAFSERRVTRPPVQPGKSIPRSRPSRSCSVAAVHERTSGLDDGRGRWLGGQG